MEIVKKHTNCRACGSDKLVEYLNLGKIPLANNLENTEEEALNAERFPLEVMLCEKCGLSQLSVVINPEKLYAYYTYRSGVNEGYKKHCKQMAKTLKERYNLNEESFVIDIAGNDGTLLMQFKEEVDCEVLNVDPAENLTDISEGNGIPAYNVFWGKAVAENIRSKYNAADVIIATNVFAHVDDIKEFLEAAKIALKSDGILVIECPYMGDHLEKMEWTQVYFEHLSYMSVRPVIELCKQVGLHLVNVEHQDIHGGTIRLYISLNQFPAVPDHILYYIFSEEKKTIKTYRKWAEEVNQMIYDLSLEIGSLKYKGAKIAAFSASAKGNTLLNSALLDYRSIDYIVDETEEKIGKYSPGTGILIVTPNALLIDPPDYLIILSWNFKDEIIEKCREWGYKGKFILPIPKFEIVE